MGMDSHRCSAERVFTADWRSVRCTIDGRPFLIPFYLCAASLARLAPIALLSGYIANRAPRLACAGLVENTATASSHELLRISGNITASSITTGSGSNHTASRPCRLLLKISLYTFAALLMSCTG